MTTLMTHREIAQHAGVEVDTVKKWRQRYASFPQPAPTPAGVVMFRRREIEKWLKAFNPNNLGRPRKGKNNG